MQITRRPFESVVFWIVQALIAVGSLAWALDRYHVHYAQREFPPLRNEPLVVGPLYDRADVISDADLLAVLEKLKPRLREGQPKINWVDHALRFWGAQAVFDDPECLSGVEMRELLLDHRRFRDAWGTDARPFLVPDTRGLSFRTQEGSATASHVDHTLAGLAEVGTPLDHPVITPAGETTLRAALEQSLADFSLNQVEYEWSTLACVLYLPPVREWYSTEGQQITFDRLARRIMRQRLAQGVCRGNHRLHALVMLLRVDERFPILSDPGREEITRFLQDVTRRLVENQEAEGSFTAQWPGEEFDGPQSEPSAAVDLLSDRMLVTGHVLEWWSLAPPEVQPPPEIVVRAARWLTKTILDMPDSQVRSSYPFLTHAGRALALWRGRFPAEIWNAARGAGRR